MATKTICPQCGHACPMNTPYCNNGLCGNVGNRVLVVYDSRTPDSGAVARYYANARHIPAANLCAIPLPEPGKRILVPAAGQDVPKASPMRTIPACRYPVLT